MTGYYVGISSSTYFNTLIGSVEVVTTPVLSVTPAETNVGFEATSGTLDVEATNFDLSEAEFDVFQYFESDGSTSSEQPEWLTVSYNGTERKISYSVTANDGEARSAYFKLALAYGEEDIYSDMITITQAAYVAPATEGTIVFCNSGTKINSASVTGDDSMGNTWTITTEGTTSYTPNADYCQVGSSSKPATSITFTTTLPAEATITSFEAKFGGFSGTAGDVTLKVGETTVGTGSLNAANDVTVTNTSTATGTVLTVTVTNIAKGVKCYYISYEVEAATPTEPITVTLNASGYATFSSESAVSIPEEGDFTAWQITNVDSDNKITFEQVTGNIKAETGLFLKGTANAEVTIETAASGAELSSNILVGFPISTSVGDGEYYGLSGDTFKKVNAGNVRAGKALLPAEFVNEDIIPSTGAKAFTFVFEDDDATAISSVETFTEEGAIFNLAGQRISKMQKGINIVNGKKILK